MKLSGKLFDDSSAPSAANRYGRPGNRAAPGLLTAACSSAAQRRGAPGCGLDQMFAELQAATARGMPEIGVLVAIAAKYGVAI